ncbi:MAG TPA: hypothetical protein VF532_07530 [Candidatus Angelobacter sp.]
MVRKLLIASALLSAIAAAQSAKPQTPSAKPQAPEATKPAQPSASPAQAAAPAAKAPGDDLPPTAPVITMKGLCSDATEGVTKPAPGSTKDACISVMTKGDFEKLVQAVNPALPPAMRRNLAKQLVDLMTMAQAAEKAGMQNQPNFTEVLRIQRLNVLGNLYGKSLEEQSRNVPPAEIDAYYKSHLAQFEEVKLQRIYVPKVDPSGKSNEPDKKAAWVAKAQQVADEMNNRAAKGDDMGTLQKEAYTTLGITTNPPNTDIGGVRKGSLAPASEQAIALLKAGGVYKSDEPSAIVIYKVLSKETLKEEAVKDEIGRTIFSEKMQARRKEINDSVKADFDDKYFGPATPPLPPGASSPR